MCIRDSIRSALEIIEKSFTYDSMFRYLRSGMSGISREDVDLLDNYCLAVGIRGSKQWHGTWVKKGRGRSAYPLDYLNEPVSYTHLRAHETDSYLVCRLLLEKKKKQ